MKIRTKAAIALAAALALPLAAEAHRPWLLPSATVLSGEDQWVTVDAAISDALFYFDHNPMKLDDLKVYGPDGAEVKAENVFSGKLRSSFDLHLEKPGTYRVSVAGDSLMGRYKLNGENKRWRGTADQLSEIPKEATEVEINQSQRRQDTFITSGKPTDAVLKPTGSGLELVPVTHPNDLVAGGEATFRFVMDGKPATDIEVTVVPGGIRYRDQINDMRLKTDAEGAVKVTWPEPGFYWLSAQVKDAKPTSDKAKSRNVSYAVTLEVQAE
jgi:uncharacterized GH25 family protein